MFYVSWLFSDTEQIYLSGAHQRGLAGNGPFLGQNWCFHVKIHFDHIKTQENYISHISFDIYNIPKLLFLMQKLTLNL